MDKFLKQQKLIKAKKAKKAQTGRHKTYHSDPEEFVKKYKKARKDDVTKSIDFRDVKVSVDANDHAQAEKTANPKLIEYLKTSIQADLEKIPFEKGALTVYKKEEGLYSGFFQDLEGQVIQKFDDMTIPILAKNLEIRDLYENSYHEENPEDLKEDIEIAATVANEVMSHHNETYHRGQEPGEPINSGGGSLRIKMGDIDIEIKKSINSFIKSFKTKKQTEILKAIQSWRRNCINGKNHKNDLEAAKQLLEEWDKHSEGFYQIVHAMQVEDEQV